MSFSPPGASCSWFCFPGSCQWSSNHSQQQNHCTSSSKTAGFSAHSRFHLDNFAQSVWLCCCYNSLLRGTACLYCALRFDQIFPSLKSIVLCFISSSFLPSNPGSDKVNIVFCLLSWVCVAEFCDVSMKRNTSFTICGTVLLWEHLLWPRNKHLSLIDWLSALFYLQISDSVNNLVWSERPAPDLCKTCVLVLHVIMNMGCCPKDGANLFMVFCVEDQPVKPENGKTHCNVEHNSEDFTTASTAVYLSHYFMGLCWN